MNQEFDNQQRNKRAEFEKFWRVKLLPLLMEKEKVRKQYLAKFFWLLLIVVLILVLMFLMIHGGEMLNVLYFAIAIGIYILQTPYKKYRRLVQNDVMRVFAGFFDGFKYVSGGGLTLNEMEDALIFPHFDEYKADDCFEGVYQDVKIRICEEILTQITRDSKGRRRKTTVFEGIAVELDMNKNFTGQTVVLKDAGFFNKFKRVGGLFKLENVKFEDVAFEKDFEVYSSDQIEARYILTTAFMERVQRLKDLYKGKNIQLCFENNKVMIAIDTNENMFEACSFFSTNLNKQKIDRVYEQFLTIFSIIDVLKLNTKIGL